MLDRLAYDLARAAVAVDAARPVARNKRSGEAFGAGLGPHSETQTVELLITQARRADPDLYTAVSFAIPYPNAPRQKCDLKVSAPSGTLFLECKLLRLKGDNGKPNDNMLMHILSPYPQHRSALTDCMKLRASGFVGDKAIVVIGYDYDDLPLEPAVEAFERLAAGSIGPRQEAAFTGLCHPFHERGKVLVWSVQ